MNFYVPTFRNALFHLHCAVSRKLAAPMKMERTERSETSEHKIQAPGNGPIEIIRQFRCISYSV